MESNAPATKKYYNELTLFRAFIIIWVVIGHSFDANPDVLGFLHNYAYTFHMKAFFMLSGLLFAGKLRKIHSPKDCLVAIKDRALRLLVPYYFFTVVSFILKLFLNEYANHKLSLQMVIYSLYGQSNPNGGLWFLFYMFVLNVFALALYKLPAWGGLLICTAMYVINCFTGWFNLPVLAYIANWGIFFYIGIALSPVYPKLSASAARLFQKKGKLMTPVTLLLLALSFVLVKLYLDAAVQNDGLAFVVMLYNILVYYGLAVLLDRTEALKKPLKTVGDYGMDIYMIGYYVQITLRVVLMSMLGLPYLLYSSLMCLLGLLLPIPISKYIIRKFKITRALMLGDFKRK